MNSIVAPTIWSTLITTLKHHIGEQTPYINYLDRIYRNSSTEHQHVILDVLAKTPVRQKGGNEYTWFFLSFAGWIYAPLEEPDRWGAATAMSCLQKQSPLPQDDIPHNIRHLWDDLTREVAEQNDWAEEHTYIFGTKFTAEYPAENPKLKLWLPPGEYAKTMATTAAAIVSRPPEYAPLLVESMDTNHRFTVTYDETLPGATDLYHQCVISGNLEGQQWCLMLALTYCPVEMIQKIWDSKPLDDEECRVLADMMEMLYPAREHATQYAYTGYMYQQTPDWVIRQALGEPVEAFQPSQERSLVVPLPTKQWVLEKETEQQQVEGIMILDNNHVF
jgi:hypothetical protein